MDNNERMYFEAGDDDLGLQVVAFAGGKDLSFSCNNDWCGDTESGFGATVSVSLGREDAEKLRDFLDAWLKTPNAK